MLAATRPLGPLLPPVLIVMLTIFAGIAAIGVVIWIFKESDIELTRNKWFSTGWIVACLVWLAFASVASVRDDMQEQRYEDQLARAVVWLQRPDVAPEKVLQAAHSDEFDLMLVAAAHPNAPSEALEILATVKHSDVKLIVADRRDAPIDVLVLLSTDDDLAVAGKAQRNPSLPADHANMQLMDILPTVTP